MASRDPGDPTASEDSRAAAHLLDGWLAAHGDDRPVRAGGRVAFMTNPMAR